MLSPASADDEEFLQLLLARDIARVLVHCGHHRVDGSLGRLHIGILQSALEPLRCRSARTRRLRRRKLGDRGPIVIIDQLAMSCPFVNMLIVLYGHLARMYPATCAAMGVRSVAGEHQWLVLWREALVSQVRQRVVMSSSTPRASRKMRRAMVNRVRP